MNEKTNKRKDIDLGLTGLDDLFLTDKQREENRMPKIYEIPLDQIDPFPNHPYHVRMDEDMDQLVESIKERGVITPITLRQKEDGRYEIVSGHRRAKACELAGLPTVKAEIRDLTREEATILMVESNLMRSRILPSEKAFAYKMRMEAMRRMAGRPSKENSGPVVQNSSRDELGEDVGESGRQVSRYIRLTNLAPPLLDMVDEGQIAMRPAVELSYLSREEQADLLDSISYTCATPSYSQAIKMRRFSEGGRLSADVIDSIMSEEKGNQKEKISLRYEEARKYIPPDVPYEETNDYIIKALDFYTRHREKMRRDAR